MDDLTQILEACIGSNGKPGSKAAKYRQKKIRFLLERDGFHCAYCDIRFSVELPPTLDHVTPKSEGGPKSFDNFVLACFPCNLEKGNLPLFEFLDRRFRTRLRQEIQCLPVKPTKSTTSSLKDAPDKNSSSVAENAATPKKKPSVTPSRPRLRVEARSTGTNVHGVMSTT